MRTEAAHRHRPNLSFTAPLSATGATAAALLRTIDDDTVHRLVERVAGESAPPGAALPACRLRDDLATVAWQCVEFAAALLDGRDETRAAPRKIEGVAAGWADAGAPASAIHRTALECGRLVVDRLSAGLRAAAGLRSRRVLDEQRPARPLHDLIRGQGRAADSEIAAAVVAAAPSELPDAAAQAHEPMDLVRRPGYRPGLYRVEDCALEHLFTRPGAGQRALASMLDPLEGWPELLETLHCHLRHNGYRRATARALRLHENTVPNRLRRIGGLTGAGPFDPTGMRHLRSALPARDAGGPSASAPQDGAGE